MTNKMNGKGAKFMRYYHETLKGKLCAIFMFTLGALSMNVSLKAVTLVFIALFVMPLFFTKSKRIPQESEKSKEA